jgi:hypothetical protein
VRRHLALLAFVSLTVAACGEEPPAKTAADVTASTDTAASDSTGGDPATWWAKGKTRKDEARPAGKGPLQAGVAMRYLDGPVGTSMAGYGGRLDGRRTHWSDRIKGSAGFYGMQSIKVVVFEAGGEKLALVKSPMMSSESWMTDAIARHLQETHKLDFQGRVVTMAGHSHHATARYWPVPDTLGNVGADSFDAEVADTAARLFADAIAEAWQQRAPAEWGYAHDDNWDPKDEVYRDRRENNNPKWGKDPRLTVIGVRRKSDATPLAVILNLPIHGTVFGGNNDLFTEDAPGYVEHKFEELFFATTGKPVYGLLAQSSGGDASPAGDSLGHPELARLERLGEAAAPKIVQLYQKLSWSAEIELAVRSQRLDLIHQRVYDGYPWKNEFANEFNDPYLWGGWQCNGSGQKEGETMQGKAKLCIDMGKFLSLLEAPVPHNAAHQAYLTAGRLGDLWFITMPGEPNWSITQYARELAAKKTWNGKPMELMVVGYAQDHLLYLSHPDDWYYGGYEAEMSLWGPGGGPFLADQGLAMIDAMAAGNNGPAFQEDSPSLAPVPVWQPRPREGSLAIGQVLVQPPAQVQRTQTIEFAANCGDPALGSPLVEVQRDDNGKFSAVPARHGWTGRAYDNSRYEMISAYDPDPPQLKGQSVPERTHTWRFYWQIPADWPAASYRLHLQCKAWNGIEIQPVVVDSTAFAVGLAAGTTLTASVDGTALQVAMRVPGVAQSKAKTKAPGVGQWIAAGYRLLDRDVAHESLAVVRAPLQVEVLDAGGAVVAQVAAPFDATKKAAVATLPAPPPKGAKLRAWLAADGTPASVTVPLP